VRVLDRQTVLRPEHSQIEFTRTTDELFSDQPDLEERIHRTAGSTFRIAAYTRGYTRDIELFHIVQTGIGGNFSVYGLPDAIKPYYGDRPLGVNVYVRFRLRQSK